MMGAKMEPGLPFEDYLKLDAVNATLLKNMLTSPRLCRHRMQEPLEDSDELRQGRACHTAILEPDRFLLDYTVWRKPNGRRMGKRWDDFCAANADKTILTEEQYLLACKLRDVTRSHPVAGRYLSEAGRAELTLRWTHQGTGVPFKARLDWLGSAMVDLKTCRDPSPHAFGNASMRYGYALQMAVYDDGLASIGEHVPLKLFAMQKVEPFDVVVYDVTPETLAIGHEQLERALRLYVECRESNKWPGLAEHEEVPLVLPAWARSVDDDEFELTLGGEAIAV